MLPSSAQAPAKLDKVALFSANLATPTPTYFNPPKNVYLLALAILIGTVYLSRTLKYKLASLSWTDLGTAYPQHVARY